MQYLLVAYDGKDSDSLSRRMAARDAHIKLGDKYRGEGKHLYAAAILDDAEQMIGSVMIVDFTDRAELDEWLKVEPYVTGKVWDSIEIKPCRVGPSFANLRPNAAGE